MALFFRHIHPFKEVIENAIAAVSATSFCAVEQEELKYRRFDILSELEN